MLAVRGGHLKTSQRPLTVASFEVIAIAAVCLTFALAPELSWVGLAWPASMLCLIVWITRLRSRAARWIYSVIAVLAASAIAYGAAQGIVRFSNIALETGLFLATVPIELGLLWSAPTSRWLNSNHSLDERSATAG
jgi:hypothetical protein